jgi:ArsR family metal-binding transcriptional regulator
MTFQTDIKARTEALFKRRDELIQIAADGNMTGRTISEGLELFARMDNIRDEIIEAVYDGRVKFSSEVFVSVDNTKIKFVDIDKMSEWMVKHVT